MDASAKTHNARRLEPNGLNHQQTVPYTRLSTNMAISYIFRIKEVTLEQKNFQNFQIPFFVLTDYCCCNFPGFQLSPPVQW